MSIWDWGLGIAELLRIAGLRECGIHRRLAIEEWPSIANSAIVNRLANREIPKSAIIPQSAIPNPQ
jgi:hypothetical protein